MKEYILSLVTAVLGVAAVYVRTWIAANVKPKQLQTVLDITRTVVGAADKIGQDFGVDNKAKYDFASKVLKSSAKKVGVRLSDGEAMAFIHAVLKEIRAFEDIEFGDIEPEPSP